LHRIDGLEGLDSLTRLDLSHNRLTVVSGLAGKVPKLRCLHLEGNKLDSVACLNLHGQLDQLPELRALYLQDLFAAGRAAADGDDDGNDGSSGGGRGGVLGAVAASRGSGSGGGLMRGGGDVTAQVISNSSAAIQSSNGCCREPGYKATVIAALPNLTNLDGER
jgi:Leucine-rich repeat (LRR) protein